MKDTLPWGWLNAAPELVTPAEVKRDLAATADAVAFHAIVAHWDDVVPCNSPDGCERPAYWVYHCPCGRAVTVCTPHKVRDDFAIATWGGGLCLACDQQVPSPIPWLPL